MNKSIKKALGILYVFAVAAGAIFIVRHMNEHKEHCLPDEHDFKREPELSLWPETINVVEDYGRSFSSGSRSPHEVTGHVRTLPEGWHASDDKWVSASENGYTLADNQTWVKHYSTGSHDS